MLKFKEFVSYLNEAKRGTVYKAAKKGSYPAVIVVIQDGKVIHQEPVSTPDIAPATFNVMQEKYPKAILHLEDKTGKRLFSESVVTEAKNTIGLAFKEEQDYLDFVEFIKDERGSIKKDFGWDSKTKSWEVIMDVKVLDRIYGEGTPSNKESGWYGGLPGDFESVIIESVVTEGKTSAVYKDPKTGKGYDLQYVSSKKRWELDIMKKGASMYSSAITTIKRDTLKEIQDWLDGYKIDSKWTKGLSESVVTEGKMPNKLIGNDEIVFLKTKDNSRGAHYNLYYKGHDIDLGGRSFGNEKELEDFAGNYILSNQLYKKLRYEDSKPLPESLVTEAEKYVTDKFKVGDKIKTGFGEWEVIETDYAPKKSFIGSFIFKGDDMKRVNIPNPPKTNKNAVGYKVTDGDKYPIIGFLYQYKDITKLATIGVDESVNEGGNAVEESRPLTQKEVIKTFEWTEKNVLPLLGLDGNGVDYSPIGSYAKKTEDVTSGDIDIAVSVDKIAGVNGLTFEEVLPWLDEKLKSLGYSTKMVRGFEQISFGAPIDGDYKNGIGQVDLMLSTDLNWSKFMYHSPNFIIGESKYKGMYRNVLLMSIVSEMFKESSKLTPEGDTEQYKQYVIRLEKGIFQVEKSFMGKKGSLIKTANLLKDQDKFITNTPEDVVELAFGEGVKPLEVMTFEDAWTRLQSPKFPHKKKLDQILNRFKTYILASKMPLPSEAVEAYPNLF